VTGINAEQGPVFHQQHVLLQTAIYGQGLALAQSRVVEEDLQLGRLIRPFKESVPHPCAYYMVHKKEQAQRVCGANT
jgi:LysR family transcriptional regulator, glycine cleavage system transcriptional activator